MATLRATETEGLSQSPLKELFPKGTVGYSIISEFPPLTEHYRRDVIMGQPLDALWQDTKNLSIVKGWRGKKVTAGNILSARHMPRSMPDDTRSRLRDFLAIIPQGRLLAKVCGREAYPMTPRSEAEVIDFMNERVVELGGVQSETLRMVYGLDNGILVATERAGEQFSPPRNHVTVRQNEVKGLRNLQIQNRDRSFNGYLALPPDSLGRKVFGVDLQKDLPAGTGWIYATARMMRQLEVQTGRSYPMLITMTELLKVDPRAPFSQLIIKEVEDLLKTELAKPTPLIPVKAKLVRDAEASSKPRVQVKGEVTPIPTPKSISPEQISRNIAKLMEKYPHFHNPRSVLEDASEYVGSS